LVLGEVNLSDLFNPATFLGALRQQTARESNLSMDELKLVNSWSRGGINNAKIPVKGQLISKCPFGVILWTKIPTKKFDNFCPRI
jgi:dynein heavy chain 2